MATTLTTTGWFGLTTGRWTTPNNKGNFLIKDNVDGIRTPLSWPALPGLNTGLSPIRVPANKFLTLKADVSRAKRRVSSFYLENIGIDLGGAFIVGDAGSSIIGTGDIGVACNGLQSFGNGANRIEGTSDGYNGIRNYGVIRFGNGNNTLRGACIPVTPVFTQSFLSGGIGINNEGTIVFGDGNNIIDALSGGFAGRGYIQLGSGANTVKGFGNAAIEGGGNRQTRLLLDQGTYQIASDGAGSFQINRTGESRNMDITGIPIIGAATGRSQTVGMARGTLTIDVKGQAIFDSATGSNAFMVYDARTHLNPSSPSYTTANSFYSDAISEWDGFNNIPITYELRFASTISGQTLALYDRDTGVGRVTIGTGTGTTAVTTGTTTLHVNASTTTRAMTFTGNSGINRLTGGSADDVFIASTGHDTLKGGRGSNTADYSSLSHAISVVRSNRVKVNKGKSAGIDTLLEIQNIIGSSLNDDISGDRGNNRITGGLGTDRLDGREASDTYVFRAGAEHRAAEIKDTGAAGTDTVIFNSTQANDTLKLFADDTGIEEVRLGEKPLNSNNGSNYKWRDGTLHSIPEPGTTGTGDTALNIDASNLVNQLTIVGNDGMNTILGSRQNNIVFGGAGLDTIIGGAGDDSISGGLGNDLLTGSIGKDIFVFDCRPDNEINRDLITDFNPAEDRLRFITSAYPDTFYRVVLTNFMSDHPINADQFVSAATDQLLAQTSTPSTVFLYNTTTGVLSYDQDGSFSNHEAIEVAVLGTGTIHPALTATNIIIQHHSYPAVP